MREGDKASNFWPLAILSFGESWHNLHHCRPDQRPPRRARGQIDSSARLIWIFEKFGWASERPVADARANQGQTGEP